MENATSFAFELDKPYTAQRDDEEEITVCSKGSSSSNPTAEDNVLHYRTEVPIRVKIKFCHKSFRPPKKKTYKMEHYH